MTPNYSKEEIIKAFNKEISMLNETGIAAITGYNIMSITGTLMLELVPDSLTKYRSALDVMEHNTELTKKVLSIVIEEVEKL